MIGKEELTLHQQLTNKVNELNALFNDLPPVEQRIEARKRLEEAFMWAEKAINPPSAAY
jgi:hypothetical protein